jgi:hypothetical protein
MCTAVVLLALSGFTASAIPDEPRWLDDYGKARQQGRLQEKPLAVFIGSGTTGWDQVTREGSLGKKAGKLLAANYVCLYVNTREEAGQRLASALDISTGPGLVISNHTGALQAFRHEGDLSKQDLEAYLRRFADPDRAVTQTETRGQRRTSYYSGPSGATMGNFVPVFTSGRSC